MGDTVNLLDDGHNGNVNILRLQTEDHLVVSGIFLFMRSNKKD